MRQTYTERRRLAPEYILYGIKHTHTATHAADDIYNYRRTRVRSDSYTILINTLRSRVSRPMAMNGHVGATWGGSFWRV